MTLKPNDKVDFLSGCLEEKVLNNQIKLFHYSEMNDVRCDVM